MPFLTLVALGLIFVLLFQLWGYVSDRLAVKTENKAAVTLTSGSAEMQIWGNEEPVRVLSGTLLREGDTLRTFAGTKLSLSLLNNSVIRVGEDTEFVIEKLESRDGQDGISLLLKKGDVWLKRSTEQVVEIDFSVLTDDMTVRSLGTTFAVSRGSETAVRVIEGSVEVDVKSNENGKERVIETIVVGIGQEVVIGEREMAFFKQRKPQNVLYAISDAFHAGEWYAWNRTEDQRPREVVTVADAVEKSKEPTLITESPDEVAALPAATPDDEPATPLIAIIEPAEPVSTVKTGPVVIKGTTGTNTAKIIVTTYEGGKTDTYTLSRYTAGSTEWNYIASEAYGSLKPGENKFTIEAVSASDVKSAPIDVVIKLDKPLEPADLSAPTVTKFNDSESSETTEDIVRVGGTIGKGIAKIVVNGFELTKFTAGGTEWAYYAKVEYGNFKEGTNDYEVYGVDPDGNKTAITRFTITKKPKPADEETPSVTP